MKLESYTDDQIGADLQSQITDQYNRDLNEIANVNVNALPTSLTPADLSTLYEAQARLSADLFRVGALSSKWHRLYIEATALLGKRESAEKKKLFAWIADANNTDDIKHVRSEEGKLAFAADQLNLEGTKSLEYLTAILKGYHSIVTSAYQRLEKQTELLLTQLSILKIYLGIHGNNGS